MGGPRLVAVVPRPHAQTDGDVLYEYAYRYPQAFKGMMRVVRYELNSLPPPLRAKAVLRDPSLSKKRGA